MSDFETLSLMLMILAIIIPLLVELIKSTKKYPPLAKVCGYFFE